MFVSTRGQAECKSDKCTRDVVCDVSITIIGTQGEIAHAVRDG